MLKRKLVYWPGAGGGYVWRQDHIILGCISQTGAFRLVAWGKIRLVMNFFSFFDLVTSKVPRKNKGPGSFYGTNGTSVESTTVPAELRFTSLEKNIARN